MLEGPTSSAALEAEAGLGYGVSPVVLSAAGLLCTCDNGGSWDDGRMCRKGKYEWSGWAVHAIAGAAGYS